MERENTNWKYVVYQTTNLINNYIYVGVHKTQDPNVFDGYLGCGVYVNWERSYKYAKTAFQKAVKTYGPKNFKRVILSIFDTEDEAYLMEADIVNDKFLERSDVYNMVLGGKSGIFETEKIKVYRYDYNGNYLEEFDSFADAGLALNCDYTLISYAVRKKTIAKKSFWNTDKMDKLDLSEYKFGFGDPKEIFIYDLNGTYLTSYTSISDAEIGLNTYKGQINKCAELGIILKKKYQLSFIKADTYDEARSQYVKQRAVFRYNSDGSFSYAYSSQKNAEKDNPNSNISKAIRLKEKCKNGYFWGLRFLKNYNVPKLNQKKRKIGKYDLNGNLIEIYDSATAAEKANGTSVWKVLNGTNQTHKQHIYKYLS